MSGEKAAREAWAQIGITWNDREWRQVRRSGRRKAVRIYFRNLWDALRGVH